MTTGHDVASSFALALLCTACGSTRAPASATLTASESATPCTIDGQPLDSFEPPTSFCVVGSASEALANGLRLYAQERYVEAAVQLEHATSDGRDPEWPMWWQQARYALARTYDHLDRDDEGRALLLEIVRTADDPHRWAAAGALCGEVRTSPSGMFAFAACPDPFATDEPSVVIPTGPIPPRVDPIEPADASLPVRPYPSVVHRANRAAYATFAACGPRDYGDPFPVSRPRPPPSVTIDIVFASEGSVQSVTFDERDVVVIGTEIETCLLEAAHRMWLPPFTDPTFTMTEWVRFAEPTSAD